MRKIFAITLSFALLVLAAPSANAAVEATYSGGGAGGTSVRMDRGSGAQTLGTKLFNLNVTGEGTLPAYCIDIRTGIQQTTYEERDWSVAGQQREKILWILKNSYPTVSEAALGAAGGVSGTLSTKDAIGATQAAIWTFSDSATYIPGDNAAVNTVVAYLTGSANVGTTTPPAASLTLDPTSKSGEAGGARIGPFTLAVSDRGEAALSLSPTNTAAKVFTQASGGSSVPTAKDGDQLWIDVPAGTNPGSVELKATASTTAFAGRVFTKKNDPNGSQKLILAKDTTVTSSAKATASWTPTKAQPSVDVTSKCLVDGGVSGNVSLTNGAPAGGPSVTFTVTIPGQGAKDYTVAAKGIRDVPFTFTEDQSPSSITVTAAGMTDYTTTVSTNCMVANPQADISAKCLAAPTGGASVTVALTNPDIAGSGQTAQKTEFTVLVDGVPQKIDGTTSWTVQPNGSKALTFTVPEGSGTAKVEVKADGNVIKTQMVATDCAVPAAPKATVDAKCVPATDGGGATVNVTLSNNPSLTGGQTSVPAVFRVFVNGTVQPVDGASSWSVKPGDEKTLTFTIPEGTGPATVTIEADGAAILSQDVTADCVVEAVPAATIAAKCVPAGGASVDIDLANNATPNAHQTGDTVTFTVWVDNVQQSVEGKTSWTLGAAETQKLTLPLAEDSGSRQVQVRIGDTVLTSRAVSTDCQVSNSAYTPVVTCGQAVVTFTNAVTPVDGQFAVDASFDVVVDGGQAEKVVVKANTPETRTYVFGEDTGRHQIVVNDGTPIVVESDCIENTAKLTIRKVVVGATEAQQSTLFDFTATTVNGDQKVTVPAGTTSALTYTVPTEGGLQVSVIEAAKAGWHMLGTPVCVQDNESEDRLVPVSENGGVASTTANVLLFNGAEWTCTFTNEPDGQRIDKSAVVAEGTAVEVGEQITYSVKVDNVASVDTASGDVVDTLPAGVSLVTGSISDGGKANVDGTTITWADVSLAPKATKTFTYKVTVNAGFGTPTLVNKVTWLGQSDQTVHPVKAIKVSVSDICRADTPFYAVNVESQNLPAVDPATNQPYQVKVEWLQADKGGKLVLVDGKPVAAFNPATNQPYVDIYPLVNGKLATGELLWKSAKVDAQGKPTDWPGWDQLPDGTWIEVPDGGVRPAAVLRVSVNPTMDTVALYPPATPACNANPPASVGGIEEVVDTPDGPADTDDAVVAGSEDELAETGGDLGPLLALSMLALVTGAVLFGTGRLARR